MNNNIITVSPGQDTSVSLPESSTANSPRRSVFDGQGREKRRFFVKRMNSAALALFADTALTTILLIALLVVLLLALGIFSIPDLPNLLSQVTSGEEPAKLISGATLMATIAMSISMVCGHIIPAYMHSARCNFSVMSALKPGRRLGMTLPAAILVSLGITYAWVFIYTVCGKVFPDSFFASRDLFASSFSDTDLPSMIVMGITTGILVPIAEEFLFRGALLKSFSKYGTGFAVFASSLLFGLMHGNMLQTPFAALGGAVMAYVAVRSGSIWPSIIIHICINSYSVICDVLRVTLPSEYLDMLNYCITGLSGLFILTAVIILCTCARRISWTAIDPNTNNVLLPEVKTQVRFKGLRFMLSFGILLFLVIYIFALLIDMDIFGDASELFENYSTIIN